MTRIALLGFGEAGQAMARTWSGASDPPRLAAYDMRFAYSASPALALAAEKWGVERHADASGAIDGADVVFSLVVGSAAVALALDVAPLLKPGQTYVDLNSVSPATKRKVGDAVAASGARFVEGAIMAGVPPLGHRVPILLAGEAAQEAADILNGLGMSCEMVGTEIGQAGAVKMIRSIVIKGLEAILIETLGAAQRAGLTERTLDSMGETFPLDWRAWAKFYFERTLQHGARRASEVRESVATLRELGMEPLLSPAIATTIDAAHERLRRVTIPDGAPYSAYLEVFAARADDAANVPPQANA